MTRQEYLEAHQEAQQQQWQLAFAQLHWVSMEEVKTEDQSCLFLIMQTVLICHVALSSDHASPIYSQVYERFLGSA
jgi:hypothetical protein